MIDILSITAAWHGSTSETAIPGTHVRIAPWGPRTWAGAWGLGWDVWCGGGPPSSQTRMTERSSPFRDCPPPALARSTRLKPVRPMTPARSKLRRESRPFTSIRWPLNSNIVRLLLSDLSQMDVIWGLGYDPSG